jgi:hypothetical protein
MTSILFIIQPYIFPEKILDSEALNVVLSGKSKLLTGKSVCCLSEFHASYQYQP